MHITLLLDLLLLMLDVRCVRASIAWRRRANVRLPAAVRMRVPVAWSSWSGARWWGPWARRGGVGVQREGHDAGTARHVGFSKLPVHCFSGAPWDGELFGDFGPHLWFESGRCVSWGCRENYELLVLKSSKGLNDGMPTCSAVRLSVGGALLPFIEAGQFVFTFLVPLAPSLKIVLVMKAATNGTASWQPLRNILPLHAAPS